MVDFALDEQQTLYQRTARDFALKTLAPAAEAARIANAAGQSPWPAMSPAFALGAELGFTRLLIPEAYGGLGGRCIDLVLVMEELGAGDLSAAASYFNVSITAPMLIVKGGDERQKRDWLGAMSEASDYVLASASAEANVAGADSFCPYPDPRVGLRTFGRRDGDHYSITGAKAGFSTNAPAAKAFFVMARTDLERPARESTSLFFIPADTPGVRVGRKTELFGWKSAAHAEVFFDDVRVPVGNRIGAEGANSGLFFFETLPFLSSGLAAAYVGLARAAFEYAFAYAHDRKSWGKPIIEHQAVALKLADMAVDLEAARLMVWQAAWAADRGDPRAAGVLAPAAKTFAVQAAIRNAERAVKILGGYGVTSEFKASGMLADAWVGDSCDGTHDMLRLSIVDFLRMSRGGFPPQGGPPGEGPPPFQH